MIRSMEVECISYRKTGYFSNLINDYLDESEHLRSFYHRFPRIDSFGSQIEEKKSSYPKQHRLVLHKVLSKQYEGFQVSSSTQEKLKQLKNTTTFTVVTGHQLNLFTGPLYFLYKIVSTINLCLELKEGYPEFDFVPVYWMASEDHDFEEINYFNFRGQKLRWNRDSSGAVGRLKNDGLEEVFEAFKGILGNNNRADEILGKFKRAYLQHKNLADATRHLANELFGEYGLVIVDGDDAGLKELLSPYALKDIIENTGFNAVNATIEEWQNSGDSYHLQVNPREINYFYLKDGLRERIVNTKEGFGVNNTDIRFSKSEILQEVEQYPERFSPNVISRPLYQEIILPNLCYIGGGGEIAYWLELKKSFDDYEVPFPILLLRNSALMISEKQYGKLQRLDLSLENIFLKQSSFINKKIREISNINIDFTVQKDHLRKQFEDLYRLAQQTDKSFLGAVRAQEAKQTKGLERLEKRLLKAQKRKLKDQVVRMTELQNELFPNQSLQERTLNFSEVYLEYGSDLIPMLLQALRPLKLEFTVIKV
ncbi:MAG: bacillithiol biosynthesis cysteine-adding enzyme BshC [Flavobacteriaceae bacterium]